MTKDDIYSITQQFNAKKGIDIFVVRIIPNVDMDDFSNLRQQARELDGYYSNFVHGFVFNTENDAVEFGEALCEYFEVDDVPGCEEEPVTAPKKQAKKKGTKTTEEKKPEAKHLASSAKPRPQVPNYDMTGIGSLKLHEAIKRILDCDGTDALKDVTIVNLLSDFQAYKDVPSSKFVLRMFISDGYIQKLLTIGKWNNQCQMLVNKFVGETGFQNNVADLVIQSVACALGWKQKVELTQGTTGGNNTPSPQSSPQSPNVNNNADKLKLTSIALNKKSDKFQLDYCEMATEYLDSIVEFSEDFQKTRGFSLNVFSKYTIYCNPTSHIEWNLEIKGSLKFKQKGYIINRCFDIVMYNQKGRILNVTPVYLDKEITTFGVKTSDSVDEQCFNTVGNIGKIVVIPGDQLK